MIEQATPSGLFWSVFAVLSAISIFVILGIGVYKVYDAYTDWQWYVNNKRLKEIDDKKAKK